jgi:putative tryptophan/tyrosine transport system substrate-binding protein
MTFFHPEINAKRLELLKEAFPPLRRVAIFLNPNNPANRAVLREMKLTAESLRVDLQEFEARGPSDFPTNVSPGGFLRRQDPQRHQTQ